MGLFSGKTAVVVGMGKGKTLGFGVADAFARAGANVAIVGRSANGLKNAAALIAQHGAKTMTLKVDSAEPGEVGSAVAAVVDRFGSIDALVNCMQAAKSAPLAELGYKDFELALDTGLKTAFAWMASCYPQLRLSRGSIVNLISRAGMLGQPHQAPLAVAKEGVRALSMVAAHEWEASHVRVNCLCAMAKTAQFEQWALEFPESFEALCNVVGQEHLVELEQAGDACVQIAAEAQSGKVYSVTRAGIHEEHVAFQR